MESDVATCVLQAYYVLGLGAVSQAVFLLCKETRRKLFWTPGREAFTGNPLCGRQRETSEQAEWPGVMGFSATVGSSFLGSSRRLWKVLLPPVWQLWLKQMELSEAAACLSPPTFKKLTVLS